MADKKDDKKVDKKVAAPPGHPVKEGMFIAGVVFFIAIIIVRAMSYYSTTKIANGTFNTYLTKITGGENGWYVNTLHYLNVGVDVYVKVATVFCIVVFLAIIYVQYLTNKVFAEEAKKDQAPDKAKERPSEQSQKWQRILSHANSQNAAEWRLSVLEADVLLDDLLQSLGYHGSSLGERLKGVNKGDFKTIDAAWEAHKIRNLIAHEGTDFPIDQRDVKRVIELYNQVFKEFSYV